MSGAEAGRAAQEPSPAWLRVLHAARNNAAWRRAFFAAPQPSPEALLARPDQALSAAGIDTDGLARLRDPQPAALERLAAWLAEPSHHLVTWGSAEYPARLAQMPDAPLALWVVGQRLELLAAPQIAIVGSRNGTHAGRDTARSFAAYLSHAGLTVTSGLAVGIDAAAHEGALEADAVTIAVLGCGIDRTYPAEHRPLAQQIAASGLLVSEYPPGVAPLAHHFPERNRIIAGLSLGTLVVEASRRSGALGTAKHAMHYGREVFAIPGSIHHPLAKGCHWLLKQGAKLVEEGADILIEIAGQVELPLAAPQPPPETPAANSLLDDESYRNLLNNLDFSPTPFGDIQARCGLTTAELSSMLLLLELDGLVEALPGGRYCLVNTRSR